MKAIFFEVSKEDAEVLKKLLPELETECYEETLSIESAPKAQDADIVSVFINSEVTAEVIDALPRMRLLTTRSAGFDHIDIPHTQTKSIAVARVPAYGSHTVAEFAFALILALSRKIFPTSEHVRDEHNFSLAAAEGFDLFGKTLGIVGTGRIGKNAAKIAKGFGMEVVAFDTMPDSNFAAEVGLTYVALPELLAQADIITIHIPYTKETHHLLNQENMRDIKRGAVLINTARGEIIETAALLQLLTENILAGVGLDVFEGERSMKRGTMSDENKKLIDDPRVIATPHMAFFSKEAKKDILETTAQNCLSFVHGTPQNLITL